MPLGESDLEVVNVIAVGISNIVSKELKSEDELKPKRTNRHICRYPKCHRKCKVTEWSCKDCWLKLPRHLQYSLFEVYNLPIEILGSPDKRFIEVEDEVTKWVDKYGTK